MKLTPNHQGDDRHGRREYRIAGRKLAGRADPPSRGQPERTAALGGA